MRLWTDPAGAVATVQSYAPFGEPLTPLAPSAPWGFTGEWHGSAGLLYLRARWYNLALGRFGQMDAASGALQVPAAQHPFAYALGNPLTYKDPAGLYVLLEDPRDWGGRYDDAPWESFAVRRTGRGLRVLSGKGGQWFRNYDEVAWANLMLLIESGNTWQSWDVPRWPGGAFGRTVFKTIENAASSISGECGGGSTADLLLDPYLVAGASQALAKIAAWGAADVIGLLSAPPTGPDDAASGMRLRAQLSYEEATSNFTPEGRLKPETVQRSRVIIPGEKLRDPAVIAALTSDGSAMGDWAKMSTETINCPGGKFQVHFYMNLNTGEVSDYGMKAVLTAPRQ